MTDDQQRVPHGDADTSAGSTTGGDRPGGAEGATQDDRSGRRGGLDQAFDAIRGLGVFRRSDDKWIGGVCSGIGDRFGVDPTLVRAGMVLLGVLGGVGVTLYLLAWALLPDDLGDIAVERAVREGDLSSILLTVVAALVLFSGFPWWWGDGVFGWNFPWLLLLVVGVVWWFLAAARKDPPASSPEQRASRQERRERHAQEWGERAGAHGRQWAEHVSSQGQQWGEHLSARSRELGDRVSARSQEFGDRISTRSVELGDRVSARSQDEAERLTEKSHRRRERRRAARESRRPSGGAVLAIVTIGLALMAYGALQWSGPVAGFSGNWDVIALAAALAVFGVVLLLVGLWGRRSGVVGFIAVLMGLVTIAGAAAPDNLRFGGRVGTERWVPSVVSTDADYRVMIGDGTIDLTRLPAEGLDRARIDTSVGIGGLTVIVPDDLTVRVKAHVAAGEIKLPRGYVSADGQSDTSNGLGVSRDVVIGDGPTEVVLDASVGTGQIRVDRP